MIKFSMDKPGFFFTMDVNLAVVWYNVTDYMFIVLRLRIFIILKILDVWLVTEID